MLRSTIDANYVIAFNVKNNINYYEFKFKEYLKTIDYFTLIILIDHYSINAYLNRALTY